MAVAVVDAPDKDDMASWKNWWVVLWRGSAGKGLRDKEALEHIKEKARAGELGEPFMSFIEATPEGTTCTVDEMRYWIPVPWTKYAGKVTLAGDAAHPMLPCKSFYSPCSELYR